MWDLTWLFLPDWHHAPHPLTIDSSEVILRLGGCIHEKPVEEEKAAFAVGPAWASVCCRAVTDLAAGAWVGPSAQRLGMHPHAAFSSHWEVNGQGDKHRVHFSMYLSKMRSLMPLKLFWESEALLNFHYSSCSPPCLMLGGVEASPFFALFFFNDSISLRKLKIYSFGSFREVYFIFHCLERILLHFLRLTPHLCLSRKKQKNVATFLVPHQAPIGNLRSLGEGRKEIS